MTLENLYVLQEEITSLEIQVRARKRELKDLLDDHACDCCHIEGKYKIVPKRQEFKIELNDNYTRKGK